MKPLDRPAGIARMQGLLRDGTVTPVGLTEQALRRAHALDPYLNAFVRIDDDGALQRAAALTTAGPGAGQPLWGIPLAHKDMFSRPGRQPGCGVARPVEDAGLPPSPVLGALDAAGSVDIGPLSLAEFALGITGTNAAHGNAANPWDLERCSGASSSGSAVAVAAGIVPASLGTDTGASVRVPASFCGIVGLKPTAGAIDGTGVFPASWSLDSVGVMARTVEDCALIFGLVGREGGVRRGSTRPVIGIPERYYCEQAEPEVAAAFDQARRCFEHAGYRVVAVPVIESAEIRSLQRIIMRTEAAAIHRGLMRRDPDNYPLSVRKFISAGEGIPAVDYVDALRLRALLLSEALATTYARIDVLLTPAAPVLPPRYADIADAADPKKWQVVSVMAHYAQPASYLGLPALAVPFTLSAGNLPIGMQLIGAPRAEAALFAAAEPLERHWQSLAGEPAGLPRL